MPIYEYQCSKCAHVFEEWAQHFDSPEAEPCPKCGGEAHRIMSNTSFLLKGRGWYVTEYGSLKGKSEGGPASEPGSHSADTGAASSAAPAAKETAPAATEAAPAAKAGSEPAASAPAAATDKA